jgi:chaperonin GroEL (HSP60 family)
MADPTAFQTPSSGEEEEEQAPPENEKDAVEQQKEKTDNADEFGGYDPIKEEVCDMYDAGIIDPTKVARLTLENATSVAIQFLNTSCAMAASNDEKGS